MRTILPLSVMDVDLSRSSFLSAVMMLGCDVANARILAPDEYQGLVHGLHEEFGCEYLTVHEDLLKTPTTWAVDHCGSLCALEGSHRLAAALHLGVVPRLVVEMVDGCVPDGHWALVLGTLPRYDFPEVLLLRLEDF